MTHISRPGLLSANDLSLPPILHPRISSLLEYHQDNLFNWVQQYGSPLNIVVPSILNDNLAKLHAAITQYSVGAKIFYAAKVNKSQSLVGEAVKAGLGVDVSSRYELRDALDAGCAGREICASGPAKTPEFHKELIDQQALISVDSCEELEDLAQLLSSLDHAPKARIILRYRPNSAVKSRFGISAYNMRSCLEMIARHAAGFAFEGFHFHLGGYAPETRIAAFWELTQWVEAARDLGLAVSLIDIGGGLPVRYVDAETYDAFLARQDAEHYRNAMLPGSFYPYGHKMDAAGWLETFLSAKGETDQTIAGYLQNQAITLGIEPGRSLADQTAISVFRISRVKELEGGHHVIFVEGSSFSACETWFASEFLIDPILIPSQQNGHHQTSPDQTSIRAYLAGHSCLEEDVVSNRLITFFTVPKRGDLLVYGNTAGYQMDLLENEFHRVPMPRRISLDADLTTVHADIAVNAVNAKGAQQ
ncbi:Y4yA family PLP-dependent enzyme [Thalassospira sp. TSL5-1]|uniref:Y4yA family PLP-dependent enzyme n=1 Tax=Thalassospira sp. TSL5-1 TaxID=1544451 RepID=UPI00094017A3|nr:Y4yA family PLP-dependent enzyme [Thalassospira sp. TSL5-1]OKH86826.1 hypothetical protein LF95_20725 [Thalassospira sp. TSL5-1]